MIQNDTFQRRFGAFAEPLECRRLLSSWFVAPAGADTNPGTEARPFATIQQAARTVKAGDTVTVRPGNYAGFVVGWDEHRAGTQSAPITFQADPGATIISRNNKTSDGINVENCDYIIIDGFTVVPAADEVRWRAGIRFGGGGAGNIARNNTVKARASDSYGIFCSFTTDLLVAGNTITGTFNSGIYTSNSAVRPTIRDNTVQDGTGNGLHFNGDSSQGGTGVITGATIEHNTVTNTGKTGGSAINCDGLQNSKIIGNTLKDNHSKGIALYRIDAAAGAVNNVVSENNATMAADARGAALVIKNASTGNTIEKNTLSSPQGAFVASADSLTKLTSDHNTYSGRFSIDGDDSAISFAAWQRATGQDKNSTAANDDHAAKKAAAVMIGLVGFAIFFIGIGPLLYILRRKNIHNWIRSYSATRGKRLAIRPGEEVHLLLCIADHYEPGNNKVPPEVANGRVERWCNGYPRLFGHFKDSDGRPPRHTFFYPLEQYNESHVASLAGLCAKGFGEVELHLHHDNDTSDNLRKTLEDYTDLIHTRHKLLPRDPKTGQIKYAFVHGNWALDNSHPLGRHCGVNDELTVLRQTGCYADFTMPSAPDPSQVGKINSIYYAIDDPAKPRSHETGPDVGTCPQPDGSLMLIQGPLILDWKHRKIENSCIQASQPPTMQRLDLWLRARVQVPTRPDWFFVKLHTHGCPEENSAVLLGPAMVDFHQALADRAARDPNFHYHYVTAREMYNLARAAEAGFDGPVSQALDYELVWPAVAGASNGSRRSTPTLSGAFHE